jgi:hypothetical protein
LAFETHLAAEGIVAERAIWVSSAPDNYVALLFEALVELPLAPELNTIPCGLTAEAPPVDPRSVAARFLPKEGGDARRDATYNRRCDKVNASWLIAHAHLDPGFLMLARVLLHSPLLAHRDDPTAFDFLSACAAVKTRNRSALGARSGVHGGALWYLTRARRLKIDAYLPGLSLVIFQ